MFIQCIHVCLNHDFQLDLMKKILKLQIMLLLYLLIKNDNICKLMLEKLIKNHSKFLEIRDLSQ